MMEWVWIAVISVAIGVVCAVPIVLPMWLEVRRIERKLKDMGVEVKQ